LRKAIILENDDHDKNEENNIRVKTMLPFGIQVHYWKEQSVSLQTRDRKRCAQYIGSFTGTTYVAYNICSSKLRQPQN